MKAALIVKQKKLEVIDELSSDYDEQVERFQNEGTCA